MKHLALIATAVSCMGGFFFGYDTGVISGVLTMPTFPTYFGIAGDPTNIAQTKGDVVSLLQAGCCVGALLINLLADPIGRKWSIVFSSLVFLMGSVMQVAAKNLATMMAGRFFGGFGVGACSMLVPLYIAEIAPPKLRGRLGTVYQFFNVAGIMCSYWIDYACIHNLPVGDEQWRIPLAIQLIPGGLLCIGMSLSPESLRWLSIKGKDETLQKTLVALRDLPEDHPEIIEELHEIHAAAELEKQNKQSKWTELFQPANFHRVLIAIAMQSFQQWTGTNAINYYAPEVFASIGLNGAESDILATGVYGVVKFVCVFISFFLVDSRLGRRRTLLIGSFVMMCTFYVLGGMILSIQNDNGGSMISHPGAAVGAKGYVAMICIYIFAIGFECSWGPMTWIICAEVLPTPIRAMGLSIATAFNWAMNAIIAKVTPLMITNLTYGAYFFYGSMAFIMGLFVFFFVPETKGLSLEEINNLFLKGDVWTFRDKYVMNGDNQDDEEQVKKQPSSVEMNTFKE